MGNSGFRHLDIVQILLNRGVDVDIADLWGRTPLWLAISWSYKDVAKILLERGADPNKADRDGVRPLDVISLLYEQGRDVIKCLTEGQD